MVLVIDSLPNAVDVILQNIDIELDVCYKNIIAITSWTRQCYKLDNDLLAPIFAIRIHHATIRSDELDEYKATLVFYIQYKKNLECVTQFYKYRH